MLLSCAFLPSSPLLLPGIAPQESAPLTRITEALRAVARDTATLAPTTLVVITDGKAAYDDAFAIDVADPYCVSFSDFGHLGATATYRPDLALVDALQREARRKGLALTLHTEKFLAPHCAVTLEFFRTLLPQCAVVPLYVAHGKTAKEHVAFGELIRQVVEHSPTRVSVLAMGDIAPSFLPHIRGIASEKQLAQFMTLTEEQWSAPESFGLRQFAALLGVLGTSEVYPVALESQVLFDEVGCLVAEYPLR